MTAQPRHIEVVWRRYYRENGSWLVRYSDERGRHQTPVGGAWADEHYFRAWELALEIAEREHLTAVVCNQDNKVVSRKRFV